MQYARVNLETMAVEATFDTLPPIFADTDPTTLTDMNWGGENIGYWPIENNDQAFDPEIEVLEGGITYTAVKSREVVKVRNLKRAMTDEEILARARRLSPVPQAISDRQFAEQLALEGMITNDEARAWVKVGEIPAQIKAIVDAIPDDVISQAAYMRLEGAVEFRRDNYLVSMLGAMLGKTEQQVDDIWRKAALLV